MSGTDWHPIVSRLGTGFREKRRARSQYAVRLIPTRREASILAAPEPAPRRQQLRGGAADLIDRVVGDRYDIESAVGALLDAGGRAEALADLQRLALGAVEFLRAEKIIRHTVGQAGIGAHIDVQAVWRELESIEAAPVRPHLREAAGRSHP